MNNNFSQIQVIGFDLDQTLYPKSDLIDAEIQRYIFRKIADHLHCSLAEAEAQFATLYQDGRGLSGRKTLMTLGIPRAEETIQEALENADITKFLAPNPEVYLLLERLRHKYQYIDLITGSNEPIAREKLQQLKIPSAIFSSIITGEVAKSDGTAFKKWLSFYPNLPASTFLYIGDREKTDYIEPMKLGINTILVNLRTSNKDINCLQLSSLLEIEQYLL